MINESWYEAYRKRLSQLGMADDEISVMCDGHRKANKTISGMFMQPEEAADLDFETVNLAE